MQKKILSSLLLASALPFNAHALGLGDIEVYSALNQPLDAEISIKAATPGEVDSLLVKLASEQAFLKSGVERPFMLTKLKFRSAYKADGTPIIKVTSPKAIREPFLNFLVDVEWPRGRLVREYTVLLDPPSFSTSQPVTTASPEVTKAAATGSAPIQRTPVEETGVYGFEEPEPVTQAQAAAPAVEEVLNYQEPLLQEPAAPAVEEVLSYKEPFLQEEEVVDTSSPFTELLNDIQTEPVPEFEAPTFTAPEPAAETQFNIPAPSVSLNADELPELNMSLDPTIPFNAETILASDNDYVDPEIESLLRADDSYLYREPAPQPEPEVVYVAPEPTPVVEARPDYYEVQDGDIMYDIAEQFRPSGVDINQAMLAIMRYNPEAFINDNVNLVRKGQVLRIPDEEAMLALSSRDAVAEVSGHHALWREYKAQLAGATSMASNEVASSESSSQEVVAERRPDTSSTTGEGTQLALVAPDKGQESTSAVAGGQEGSGDVRRLERNLALAKERLAASNLEQAEVQSRINELEQIVTQSEGVIQLKNQQLAQVQANAEQANESAEQVADVVKQVVDGTETAVETAQNTVETGAENAIAAVDEAQNDLLDGIEGVEDVAEAKVETPTQVNLETAETEETVAPIEIATSTGSARPDGLGGIIYDLVPPSLRPMLKPLLSGPLLFVILALPLLLLLAGLFLLLRKKKSDEPEIVFEEDNLDLGTAADEALEGAGSADNDLESTVSLDASESDDVDVEATMVATVAQTAVDPESASTSEPADDDIQDDTTAEVDVYIAYGLHDQAEELLKQSIADKPEMTAYRGKLLETYFNAGKKDEFVNEAQALNEHLNGKSSAVWAKAVVMGKEIAPDNMLFSGEEVSGDLKASDFAAAKPDAADLDLGASDDDSMDLDLSADDTDLSASPEATDDIEDEFSLDDVAAELDASLDGEADEELDFDASNFAEADGDEVDLSSASEEIDLDMDGIDLDAGLDEESSDAADIDLGEGDLSDDLDALLGDIGGDEPEDDLEDDAANALTGNLDDILDAAEAEEPALELSDADLDLDAAPVEVDELDLDAGSALDVDTPEDDGLDFDMAELDMGGADDADFSPDDIQGLDTQGLDTQGLDDSLFDDAADSTQMIDDDSLETMVDDMDGSDADFGFDDDMPDNLDEVGTKLDLAKAYIDMGDADGAKASLEEVIQEGNSQQKKEAEELLAQI